MSQINLLQRLRQLTSALADAREAGDEELAFDLEDEIAEVETELEDEEEDEYANRHQHGWR